MRSLKFSRSFAEAFDRLLVQGAERFGESVAQEKRVRVQSIIADHLMCFPRREVDPDLGGCTYEVSGTPFVLIHDFDDNELRVHLVVHASADRTSPDVNSIAW